MVSYQKTDWTANWEPLRTFSCQNRIISFDKNLIEAFLRSEDSTLEPSFPPKLFSQWASCTASAICDEPRDSLYHVLTVAPAEIHSNYCSYLPI